MCQTPLIKITRCVLCCLLSGCRIHPRIYHSPDSLGFDLATARGIPWCGYITSIPLWVHMSNLAPGDSRHVALLSSIFFLLLHDGDTCRSSWLEDKILPWTFIHHNNTDFLYQSLLRVYCTMYLQKSCAPVHSTLGLCVESHMPGPHRWHMPTRVHGIRTSWRNWCSSPLALRRMRRPSMYIAERW